MKRIKIAMIGGGYVGLVTGTCFASLGYDVTVVDIDENKIRALNKGVIPIYEPGLEELIKKHRDNLTFTTDASAVTSANAVFLAVGTPDDGDGCADLSYLYQAAHTVAPYMAKPQVLVIKSTVPVGTAAAIRKLINDRVAVISNPEFLREGRAIEDFLAADRVVIGGAKKDTEALALMSLIYGPLNSKKLIMRNESAELVKHGANAMLAARIAFTNEMADLCDACDANIIDVVRGIGSDHRIGPYFMKPGPGYSGSCFPKDVRALAQTAREVGIVMRTVEATDASNQFRLEHWLFDRTLPTLTVGQGILHNRVCVWGLSFKADTDDMRESPAPLLIEKLLAHGIKVSAYDPVASIKIEGLRMAESPTDAAKDATTIVVTNDWPQWSHMLLDDVRAVMSRDGKPSIVDARNVINPGEARASGFTYVGVGRR